jgi:hypothetical protein
MGAELHRFVSWVVTQEEQNTSWVAIIDIYTDD